MAIYYDVQTQLLSRSPNHVAEQWESNYAFSEANCWNCGGEFILERKSGGGWFQYQTCWTCGGVGVLSTADLPIQIRTDWLEFPELYNIIFTSGGSNIWEPF